MSPSFPPEILDIIVNQLRGEQAALKACCIVSKSWIHRTRIHLFASVKFHAPNPHIGQWRKTFPDPSNSPAHHTRSLSICGLSVITAEDADAGDWIRTFHNLVHLHLECLEVDQQVSLAPFRELSPALRSLSLRAIPLEVLDLICSSPLLEDLALVFPSYGREGWNTPSTSPKLTGSLELRAYEIRPATRRLLSLPGGLHFTKVTIVCLNEDVKSTMDLVSRCSDTLESLAIQNSIPGMSGTPPLDLSEAAKLKDISLRFGGPSVQRITMALQTVRSKNLRRIVIRPLYITPESLGGETVRQEWEDLDRLLVRFWTSHSIRPKIVYGAGKRESALRDLAPGLLPELTRRGAVDLVKE